MSAPLLTKKAQLFSVNNRDAGLARLEAAALTELALGEGRDDTAFRLVTVLIEVLAELDKDGTSAAKVASRLRKIASQIEDEG